MDIIQLEKSIQQLKVEFDNKKKSWDKIYWKLKTLITKFQKSN
jgi:hypothetical protein